MIRWLYGFRRLGGLLSALVLIISGCSPAHRHGKELRLNAAIDPPTLSVQSSSLVQVLGVIRHLNEGLMRLNAEGKPEPGLAESFTVSEDGLTYRFKIRDTAVWEVGKPLTSHDFVRSYYEIIGRSVAAPLGDQLFTIKNARAIWNKEKPLKQLGVRVINDKEIEITLEARDPSFLFKLTNPIFAPIPEGYAPDKPSTISAGPFYLKSWQREKQIVLAKNPHYWDAEHVYLDEITFLIITDTNTQLAMFEKGELDWVGAPFLNLSPDAEAGLSKEFKLQHLPQTAVRVAALNIQSGIFSEPLMRHAFALAIDRPTLTKENLFRGMPATSFIPHTIMQENLSYFEAYDPQQAIALFQKAKESYKGPLHLRILYRKNVSSSAVQALADNWKRLFGVECELVETEYKLLQDQLKRGNFDLSLFVWLGDFPDASNFLELYSDPEGRFNYPKWENSQYQYLLKKMTSEGDLNRRYQYAVKAQKILMDEMPIIPVCFNFEVYLCNPCLKGVLFDRMGGIDFRHAHLN